MNFLIFYLAGTFLVTAMIYSAVGFGGGSTYTALLILVDTPYQLIPVISLGCNIIVVSGNVVFAFQKKLLQAKQTLPLLISSVPLSFMGGMVPVSETLFLSVLCILLFIAGGRMLLTSQLPYDVDNSNRWNKTLISALVGAGVGFVSGLAGIGGGIFLAPLLHMFRWTHPRQIAAICSLFILVNSISGILGQWTKHSGQTLVMQIWPYWPLMVMVLLGGYIGRYVSFAFLSESMIKRMTALLILFVALRLAWRLIGA
ncbi:MAG: sulfite exporter TauE/SafE family protein [bacterium]